MRKKLLVMVVLLAVLLSMVSPVLGEYEEACLCHKTTEPKIDETTYASPGHVTKASTSCTDCHIGYGDLPHPKIAVDCKPCHDVGFTKDDWDSDRHDVTRTTPQHASETSEKEPSEEGEGTPGFSFVIAIVGLMAVAFLIRARK